MRPGRVWFDPSKRACLVGDVSDVHFSTHETCRLDKWLWSVRQFKTRPAAASACKAGRVFINEAEVKPAREVRVGELVVVREGGLRRRLAVVGLPVSRVGAKLVPHYCEDRTPAAELEQARLTKVEQALSRERGGGRPTKRDRRKLDDLHQIL